MTYAFRCPETQLVDFVDCPGRHRCPFCKGMHEAYQCGAPAPETGPVNVIPDSMTKHWDWSVGAWIESRSQRDRVYAEKGMRAVSPDEYRRKYGGMRKRGPIVSYGGQKRHASRNPWPVRTKRGQPVI